MARLRVLALEVDHRIALMAHRLTRALGFRGAFLGAISLFDLLWASTLFNPTTARSLKVAPTYHVLVRVAPLLAWAILMVGVGILTGVQAWMYDDKWAWGAAIGIKLMWAAATVASFPVAHWQVVRPTLIFLILASMVSIAATGLPFRRE